MNFGDQIQQLRERLGLTQQALAEHLGVTRVTVARWETEGRMPTSHWLRERIAQLSHDSAAGTMAGQETNHGYRTPQRHLGRTEG